LSANVRHSSESAEHYSPPGFVDAGRKVMGGIDLDPATSGAANETVRAKAIFTAASNGYSRPWWGRVWLNPPGGICDALGVSVVRDKERKRWTCDDPTCLDGHVHADVRSAQKRWWFKLAEEWIAGRVSQAVYVLFSLELLQVAQRDRPAHLPHPLQFPIAVPDKRIAYDRVAEGVRVSSSAPPHASAFVYLPPSSGDAIAGFARVFRRFGHVVPLLDVAGIEACRDHLARRTEPRSDSDVATGATLRASSAPQQTKQQGLFTGSTP
jgi:hypothetical protein